jgi:hypothetical protein
LQTDALIFCWSASLILDFIEHRSENKMQKRILFIFIAVILSFTSFQSFECATKKSWRRNGSYRPAENGEKSQIVQSAAFKTNQIDGSSESVKIEISTEESLLLSTSSEGNFSTESALNNTADNDIKLDSASVEQTFVPEESDSIENNIKTPENSTNLILENEVANVSVGQHAVNVTFSEQNLKDIFTGSK